MELKYILVRNLERAKAKVENPGLLTNDWNKIVNDPEVSVVIELMGGMEPAKTYILQALEAGKHVVTANKDLVAAEGQDLLETARLHRCDFLYEAAVAGEFRLSVR